MKNYIKLMSLPHSGSTLLAFLIGSHPDIGTVGELAGRTDYDGYKCSCGDEFVKCQFWEQVAREMLKKNISLNLKNFSIRLGFSERYNKLDDIFYYYSPCIVLDNIRDYIFNLNKDRAKFLANIIQKNIILAETITDLLDKQYFFDSTKDLYRVKYLNRSLDKKFKIIYLTRDGRGVVNSLMRKEKLTFERAMKSWGWGAKMIERVLSYYANNQGQIFHMRYEELCQNTLGSMNGLFRFIGVKEIDKLIVLDHTKFHIIGNFMRKAFDGEVSFDERWRKELSSERKNIFDSKFGKINAKNGYKIN